MKLHLVIFSCRNVLHFNFCDRYGVGSIYVVGFYTQYLSIFRHIVNLVLCQHIF